MEHLDVLVVGAGLSGVAAGHHLTEKCPWASWAIFEARDSMGGTWDLFRYPGVRSDSDMYTLGYSFRPWTDPISIADGDAILDYIRETAHEGGIDTRIRYRHRIVSADWSSEESVWRITAEHAPPEGGGPPERVELTSGFLFSCTGYYRYDEGYTPRWDGVDDFGGDLVHPQHWPEDLDYEGRDVVVIGSGATAVTLVPAMADSAGHVTMLQRSPTWMAAGPRHSPISKLLNTGLARKLLPRRWAGSVTRWFHAVMSQLFYGFCQRFPRAAARMLLKGVERELPEGFDVQQHFTPRYDPWDQRLCLVPDGDLFRGIREGTVSVVTDTIDTFTAKGIRLDSGDELDADIVVAATGLELLFLGGISVSLEGEPLDVTERLTWKGMMIEDVPNLAFAIGYTNASWTLKCDLTCDSVARLLNEMRDRSMGSVTPSCEDPTVTAEPLLALDAGYMKRAADRLPRQGSRAPWRVRQSYLSDFRAMKMGPILDEGLQLAHPGARWGRRAGEPADRSA